jgi:hypothetical protein
MDHAVLVNNLAGCKQLSHVTARSIARKTEGLGPGSDPFHACASVESIYNPRNLAQIDAKFQETGGRIFK